MQVFVPFRGDAIANTFGVGQDIEGVKFPSLFAAMRLESRKTTAHNALSIQRFHPLSGRCDRKVQN
ncbi:MAG: hypothetical protein RMY34_31465 [Aulosira sp. DedQUE10]|nr:hypothetical protein [Aulosira sp. DedQUE10]